MKQKLVLIFASDGVRIFGNRSAMKNLGEELLRLASSPKGDYQEVNVLLDSLPADRKTTILFDEPIANIMKSSLQQRILDIRIMALEEADFPRYEERLGHDQLISPEWFSAD
jgi:hypothetical protein